MKEQSNVTAMCAWCKKPMHKKHLRQAFCSAKCRSKHFTTTKRLVREEQALRALLQLHGDKAISDKAIMHVAHVGAVHSAVLRMQEELKARYVLATAMPLKTHYKASNA